MANKKRKKKKQRPEGVDPNQLRRERLEKRRRQKAEEAERRRKAQRRQKILRQISILALVLLAIWFFFFRTQRPSEVAGYELIKVAETGVNDHTTEPVEYETRPPLAGPHAPQSVACGTYGEPLADETFVHQLEHGVIGILYDPEQVPEEDIGTIESLVSDSESHMLSMPYPDMDNDAAISVTSWGEMIQMDDLDLEAIDVYVDTFRERGPERQPCAVSATGTYQPPEEVTPGEDESPEEDGTGEDASDGEE